MKRFLSPHLIIFSLLLLAACNKPENHKNSIFYDFDQNGMIPEKEYLFYPFQKLGDNQDSAKYDISVIVRYSEICNLRSLPLKMEYSSLSKDSIFEKNIEIPLFNESDDFTGKGNFAVFETALPLFDSQIPEEGFYISLSTTQPSSPGILSLGIDLAVPSLNFP